MTRTRSNDKASSSVDISDPDQKYIGAIDIKLKLQGNALMKLLIEKQVQ